MLVRALAPQVVPAIASIVEVRSPLAFASVLVAQVFQSYTLVFLDAVLLAPPPLEDFLVVTVAQVSHIVPAPATLVHNRNHTYALVI